MASPSKQALLKVFTGPHAGAELLLSEGANTVGSDDGCDIVLADPQLAGQHAVLSVAGGVVTVEAASGQDVFVDGQLVKKASVRPFQFVTVGQTSLAIGPAQEPWPMLTVPALTKPSVSEPAAVAAEPIVDSAPVAVVAPSAAAMAMPPRDRRRGVFAVVVAAVSLLAFLLLWNPFGRTPVLATQNNQAELRKQVESVLKKFTTDCDLRVEEKGRTLTVAGYVPTAVVRKELATALEAVSGNVRVSVSETAGLADAVSRVLKMHQADFAKPQAGGPGEVIVTGTTPDLAAWSKIKLRVAADVPKIRQLTDQVTAPGAPKLAVATPVTPRVAETVAVPEPPPALIPAEQVADAPIVGAALTLPIRSVTVGQSRSFVLESGERIFEGATLPGGYVVKTIAADRVVLEKMGEQTVVSVGGGK